jgi:hypothetical protein
VPPPKELTSFAAGPMDHQALLIPHGHCTPPTRFCVAPGSLDHWRLALCCLCLAKNPGRRGRGLPAGLDRGFPERYVPGLISHPHRQGVWRKCCGTPDLPQFLPGVRCPHPEHVPTRRDFRRSWMGCRQPPQGSLRSPPSSEALGLGRRPTNQRHGDRSMVTAAT